MLMDIFSNLVYLGGVISLSGIIAHAILQFRLIGRLEKSVFSVMFYPDCDLSAFEKKLKHIGNILLIVGGLFVFLPIIVNYLMDS
jgi:hypothetical protein